MPNYNLTFNYLNYIDVLRAISVILVIFFHLNPESFDLGYLGVDVFFVISGYVITNSIYNDQIINKKGIFSFYVKRFKRIYPILFLVIITFLIFYVFFSPLSGNTNFYLGSALTALLGISNFYFINNEVNYFLNDGANPLLHTWSLGIEEQFYLLYPLFLISLIKLYKNKINIVIFSIVILIFSSFIIYVSFDGIIGNFYFPLSRFWELGIGCFAFFFPALKSKVRALTLFFFLFLLSMSAFSLNDYVIEKYSLNTALVTFLIISSMRNYSKNKKLIYVLDLSQLPYLGKLSYSIYLWHLPILYFCEIYLSGFSKYCFFFTITFIFSLISYNLYETPLRKKEYIENFIKKIINARSLVILSICLLTIIAFHQNYTSILKDIKKFNYPERKLSTLLHRLDHNHKNYLKNTCNNLDDILVCEVSKNKDKEIYLTGDSHANHFLPAIDSINNIKKFYYTELAECEIIRKHIVHSNYNNYKFCDDGDADKTKLRNIINTNVENKIIIISLRVSDYFKPEWKVLKNSNPNNLEKKLFIKQKYLEFFKLFPQSKIVLIAAIPESKVMTEKCIFNEYLVRNLNKELFDKCHFDKKKDMKRSLEVELFLKEIQKESKNLYIYKPYNVLCPENVCHNYDNKNDFFLLHDKDHLSIEASKFLSENLSSFIEKL